MENWLQQNCSLMLPTTMWGIKEELCLGEIWCPKQSRDALQLALQALIPCLIGSKTKTTGCVCVCLCVCTCMHIKPDLLFQDSPHDPRTNGSSRRKYKNVGTQLWSQTNLCWKCLWAGFLHLYQVQFAWSQNGNYNDHPIEWLWLNIWDSTL